MNFKKIKKSQAWGLDLIIAMVIFSVGITAFFVYSINYSREAEENFNLMKTEGDFIFNNILSSGYPSDWSAENVVVIGISDDGKINETKLERFFELANNDYDRTKFLFNTRYNYFFFFLDNMTIGSSVVRGIGKPGTVPENINSKNLVKITRMVSYKNKPMTAYIYIWEE
jgi:hypothetical protein